MTTKEKILEVSRRLFNEKGLSSTTARNISAELGISLGNFSYHYPNKDKIVEDLYQNMLAEIQNVLSKIATSKVSIITYLESHRVVFEIQSKYKFIYLNLFQVLVNHPNIKTVYLKNQDLEKKMSKQLFDLYVAHRVLTPIKEETFRRILNVGHILHNTWLIEAELIFKGNERQKLKHYMRICCGLLEPFLTATAIEEYEDYFDRL